MPWPLKAAAGKVKSGMTASPTTGSPPSGVTSAAQFLCWVGTASAAPPRRVQPGDTHKGDREKVTFKAFSGCFRGVFRVLSGRFHGIFPYPFCGYPH